MAKVTIIDLDGKKEQDGVIGAVAELRGILIHADGSREDLGVLGRKVVTTAFCNLIVDCLQAAAGTNSIAGFKWHAAGTGTNAEAASDTALQAEIEEAGDPIRGEGTQVEGASANIYKSVGTVTFNNTYTVTEHGLFNSNYLGANPSGTLMDRTKWAGTSVVATDTIQFTYQITFTAGS